MTATKTKSRSTTKTKGKIIPPKPKPKAAAGNAESVVISVLVDESGSMQSIADATRSGFNEYVESLQKDMVDIRTYFSAIKFDSRGVKMLQVGEPLAKAVKLDNNNYRPTGGTPLFDACAKTIQATDEVVLKQHATKVIVVFQTDGEENASEEFDLPQLKAMIEERQGKGWQFVFLGAGINAFTAGTSMGIQAMNTVSYGHNDHNTKAMFRASSTNTVGFATGASMNMNYLSAQRVGAGEDASITASVYRAAGKKFTKPDLTKGS